MVKCIATEKKYQCIVETSKCDIIADTTQDKGGSGEGIRPHELLEAAAAACLNITIRMVLDDLKIDAEDVSVNVNLNRGVEGKTIFEYEYKIDTVLSDEQKTKIEDSILSCPVRQTLLKEVCYKRTE